MRRSVLADTGPLFAAVDPDDAHHERAQNEIQSLAREKRDVLIAYPTLFEAYSLVLFRLGKIESQRWLTGILDVATLINPTPEDYQKGFAKALSFADQPITLFNATLAALSSRLDVAVWTYDHHFDIMHVPIWR